MLLSGGELSFRLLIANTGRRQKKNLSTKFLVSSMSEPDKPQKIRERRQSARLREQKEHSKKASASKTQQPLIEATAHSQQAVGSSKTKQKSSQRTISQDSVELSNTLQSVVHGAITTGKMSTNKRDLYAKQLIDAHAKACLPTFDEMTRIQVEDFLLMVEQDWDAFKKAHEKAIETLTEESEIEKQNGEFDKVKDVYWPTRSICRTQIDKLMPKQAQPVQTNPNERISVELNHVEIPNTWGTFAGGQGGHTAWKSFRNCFKVIHEDKKLAPSRKCYYLSEALIGEAAGAKGDMAITEQTYNIIWSRLEDRYEDDYKIVEELINKLLNMPKMSKPSCIGLRRILDTMRDALGMLDEYYDTKQWDAILVFLVLGLVDDDTKREWEKIRPKPKKGSEKEKAAEAATQAEGETSDAESSPKAMSYVPPWKDLEKFIEQQAKYYAHLDDRQGAAADARSSNAHRGQNSGKSETKPKSAQGRAPCRLCQGPHPMFKCIKWLREMNLAARKQYVLDANLCHMCLRNNHNDLWCYVNSDGTPRKALPCPRCKGNRYHNSTLCPTIEAEKQSQILNLQSQQGDSGSEHNA